MKLAEPTEYWGARSEGCRRNNPLDAAAARRGALLREEVWQTATGEFVKYSLAYVNPAVSSVDNGRVLGYDNSHDHHHRHFMGKQQPLEFTGHEALAKKFYSEVRALWRQEDEERRKNS